MSTANNEERAELAERYIFCRFCCSVLIVVT